MSATTKTYYAGDQRPYLKLRLVYRDSQGQVQPVNLATVTRVTFSLSKAGDDGLALIEENMVVLDADSGIVMYTWQPTDLSKPGKFKGWVTLYWPNAEKETKDDLIINVKERPIP